MKKTEWKSPALLFLTAVVWGVAFVAQSVGMDYVGPFTFDRSGGAGAVYLVSGWLEAAARQCIMRQRISRSVMWQRINRSTKWCIIWQPRAAGRWHLLWSGTVCGE